MGTPNRQVTGYDIVIGASELGHCIKRLVAHQLGYTPMLPSEQMQAVYDRGHDHEDECVAQMWADGWAIHDRQAEYVIDCGARACVVVHVDGLMHNKGLLNRVLEIKSPATWKNAERAFRTQTFTDPYMHAIAWQVSAQMVATGLEAVIACVEDGTVRTFGVEVPPFSREDILTRVMQILVQMDAGLPPHCSQDDYPCPYVYLHEPKDVDDDPILDALVREYTVHDDTAKAAKAAQDAVKERIRRHMGDREKVETERAVVSVYEQAAPAKWDTDLMVADGLNPDRYRKQGAPSTRIKITERDDA